MRNTYKHWLRTGLVAVLLFTLSVGLSAAWWEGDSSPKRESILPQGNAITDGQALLRYALPIDNEAVRKIQASLEGIKSQLRGKRWSNISGNITTASRIVTTKEAELLANIPEERQPQAQVLVEEIKQDIESLRAAVEAKNVETLLLTQGKILDSIGTLEELMVQEFPFEVPAEYSNLPQLKGRATIDIKTNKGNLTVVVDGYSAPVTAGNFVDLVQRGFYDGLKFIRSEESYALQVGDPEGADDGFIDPKTGKYRGIPLEILAQGDQAPLYNTTFEEIGRYQDHPVLPFSAFGTLALARPEAIPDGGSSQVFFFLFEPELTPAGLNLLDGRYAVFGYVTEGKEVLEELRKGDVIESAKVIRGADNLVQPS